MLDIYVGFDSPFINLYLELLTTDLFTARFADCRFDETSFPQLWGEKKDLKNHITWKVSSFSCWSTFLYVWIKGPKYYPSTKHRKSNGRYIYWFKKDNKVTYPYSKCLYLYRRLKRIIYKCHYFWITNTPKAW